MVINIEEKIFRKKMDGILRKQTRYRTPESEVSEKKNENKRDIYTEGKSIFM